MSVFFTNMKAGVVASFLYFLMFYIVRIYIGTSDISAEVKSNASFSPHTAVSLFVDSILLFENEGSGINFSNMGDDFNNYTITSCIGKLILNIVFWFVLGIYLD